MNNFKLWALRRQRSSRIGYEFHRYDGYGFINFWIGSPTHHRWWAFSLYLNYKYKQKVQS